MTSRGVHLFDRPANRPGFRTRLSLCTHGQAPVPVAEQLQRGRQQHPADHDRAEQHPLVRGPGVTASTAGSKGSANVVR
jgi:hypothetical protein